MKAKYYIALVGLLFTTSLLKAQNSVDTFAKAIKAKRLKEHVYILASDSCEGRNIGTVGIERARNYIVSQWETSAVIKPYFADTWLQPFPLVTYSDRITELQAGDLKFTHFEDYMYTGEYDNFSKDLPIVFAGYGRDEDLKKIDVKGKAVFTLSNNLRVAMKNAKKALEYGAELSIIANPENTNQFESISRQYKDFQKYKRYKAPTDTAIRRLNIRGLEYRYVAISSQTVKELTNQSISHWKNKRVEENDTIGSVKLAVKSVTTDTIIENNVVAFIPGIHNDESIVIGAHYDHLGVMDDEVYHGADDNASGVAALIELASIFSQAYNDGYVPQKNIIFIAFSGEEGGLWGSKYFADHLKNKEHIKLMMNIDMIGRADTDHSDNSSYFYFISNFLADSLLTQNKQLCKKYNLTPDYSSTIDASDHKSFTDIGVPNIFYFDGINPDLHKPTDTPNKVDYKRMEKITRMIFETIWENALVSEK
ncbi:M20/M25/M40 family metallo-hydrolase [Plebeiibacterium sediminum]|uniref:M28 family metallopeptidase n=1 Tax=Plebeiibacterium sediminum TaxID=2992112 RepID=A0AAE3SHH9_9BACT|nr:M20/M25/M40 family metallo-hydrolase [Plebeiobacterium sediminum]MCW3789525.1 M28 family metallopeptidase [Plebeiobacterium sediminum]